MGSELFFRIAALVILFSFCAQSHTVAQGGDKKRDLLKKSATAAAVSLFTLVKEDADQGSEDNLVPFPLGSGVVIDFKKKIKRNYILTSCQSVWFAPKIGVASLSDGKKFNAAAFLDLRRRGPTLDGPGLVCFDQGNNYAIIDLPQQLANVPKLKLQGKLLRKNDTVTVVSFPKGRFKSYQAKVLKYDRYQVQTVGGKELEWVTKLAIVPHRKGSLGGFVIDEKNHIYGLMTNYVEGNADEYSSNGNATTTIGLATPSRIIGEALVKSNFLK